MRFFSWHFGKPARTCDLAAGAITFRPSGPKLLSRAGRRGITLVEMLVALAVTLLMMGAVITVFGFIGERVTDSRALIETNDRLRSAAHRLREDLSSITVEAIPWQRPEAEQGYLEILEGNQQRDYPRDNNGRIINATSPVAIRGDCDDLLMFTARTKGEPYRGKVVNLPGSFAESNTAEIVWYCREGFTYGGVQTYVLCRRLMLILPPGTIANSTDDDNTFYEKYDVSAHVDRASTPPKWLENSLGDLTKRENRFLHDPVPAYPHWALVEPKNPSASRNYIRKPYPLSREGEEIVLTNVLSFDVQIFDPTVAVRFDSSGAPVVPGEPGYADASANNNSPTGAYIDLGENIPGATFGPMTADAANKSRLTTATNVGYSVYDTWSFHYEQDGIRQPGATIQNINDAGTNGLDDNPTTNPGVDDMSERETSPPYPYPLRGMRVKLRVYEPSSKQIREMTIVQSFVPE